MFNPAVAFAVAARYTGAMPPPLRAAARCGVTYRPATEADLPFLALVYFSTRLEEVAQTGWPLEMQRAFLQQQHEAQHSHYGIAYPDAERLVIVHGGEDVGRLYLDEFPTQVRIIDIALLPEARGRGLGEAIMRDIGADAAARGKRVSIHVEKQNPARRLYDRLGFETVEDKGVYDLMEWRPEPDQSIIAST
jgi:ribosomal protein S18 acetylase RimI-like enzyme